MKLFLSAITKYLLGVLLVGFLLFLPAGSLSYSGGWLLMGLLFGPMLLAGLVMFIKSPAFLEKRLDAKEKQATQKGVLKFAALMCIGSFVVAGLDWLFGWSKVSLPVTGTASVLFLGAYGLYAEVMRENAYLSRTIRWKRDKKWWTPAFTASCAILCILPRCYCFWLCLWCWAPGMPLFLWRSIR